jgi:hypothetical protein
MEIKLFKKVLNDAFLGKGFTKKGSYYYRGGRVHLYTGRNDEHRVKESIIENISAIIDDALKPGGIKLLLSARPVLLYQTTLAAKEFLGIGVS